MDILAWAGLYFLALCTLGFVSVMIGVGLAKVCIRFIGGVIHSDIFDDRSRDVNRSIAARTTNAAREKHHHPPITRRRGGCKGGTGVQR